MTDLRRMVEDGRVHVFDGAMGTQLYERGVFVNVCYDELNLTRPELVRAVHREYVDAGAEILETNTFGANPVKLSGFGLDGRTEDINRAAAALAREAADGRAAVVGAIGPLGIRIEPWGPTSENQAEEYFRRQVRGLIEGGVDGFLLETFSDANELRQALRAVRSASDRPVFAQITVEEGGATSYGTDVEAVARLLDEWGADVIGVNCSVGPAETLDAVERMARVTDRPLVAQPNAGLPRAVGDRKIYLASPAYMARYAVRMAEAGARFVGGCCGTTPEHTRQIREAVSEAFAEARVAVGTPPATGPEEPAAGPPARKAIEAGAGRPSVPLEDRSALGRRLAERKFVTSIEVLPPGGWDPEPLLADAKRALSAGADVVTVAEPLRGTRRMGTIPSAILLAQESPAEIVVQYTCRDRSMSRMISDLLGLAAAGIRNVLALTGDPPTTGPYLDRTTVFDLDSIGLTNLLDHFNHGVDPGGQSVEPPTSFVVGVIFDQGATDLAGEQSRLHWKVEAGADFVVTQPVFDVGALAAALEGARTPREIPVIAAVCALESLRDAEYLAQEVPGVQIPQPLLDRMAKADAKGPDAAREEGLAIGLEIVEALPPSVRGIHVISSRPGGELAFALLGEVSGREGSRSGVD